ncbi:MAG: hypothetical protein II945_10140 [Bacteroidales bacterium]|nr:hypothetical protein [Bacteroidales bacterium]
MKHLFCCMLILSVFVSGNTQFVQETTDYRSIYRKYLQQNKDIEQYTGWEWIFVNEDDIPEMVLTTGYQAGGDMLLAIYNGKVYGNFLPLCFQYIPKKNRILIGKGYNGDNSDSYSQCVCKLKEGELQTLVCLEEIHNYADDTDKYLLGNRSISKSECDSILHKYYTRFGKYCIGGGCSENLKAMEKLWKR